MIAADLPIKPRRMNMTVSVLDAKTALLVDLQKGVVGLLPTAHPVAGVVARLFGRFHGGNAPAEG